MTSFPTARPQKIRVVFANFMIEMESQDNFNVHFSYYE